MTYLVNGAALNTKDEVINHIVNSINCNSDYFDTYLNENNRELFNLKPSDILYSIDKVEYQKRYCLFINEARENITFMLNNDNSIDSIQFYDFEIEEVPEKENAEISFPNVTERLQAYKQELERLEKRTTYMEHLNKYYEESGTVIGFEFIPYDIADAIDKTVKVLVLKTPYSEHEICANIKQLVYLTNEIKNMETLLDDASADLIV